MPETKPQKGPVTFWGLRLILASRVENQAHCIFIDQTIKALFDLGGQVHRVALAANL